jgi:CRP/FNR family transcriptional regulator, cyclic AMP receptor protein
VNVELFEGLEKAEISIIRPYFKTRSYEAGTPVITEGSEGRSLYLIARGQAIVRVGARPITRVMAGQSFGEACLTGACERVATVVAEHKLDVYSLAASAYEGLCEAQPVVGLKFTQNILKALATKMRLMAEVARGTAQAVPPSEAPTSGPIIRAEAPGGRTVTKPAPPPPPPPPEAVGIDPSGFDPAPGEPRVPAGRFQPWKTNDLMAFLKKND